jgi:hypothetical protein
MHGVACDTRSRVHHQFHHGLGIPLYTLEEWSSPVEFGREFRDRQVRSIRVWNL